MERLEEAVSRRWWREAGLAGLSGFHAVVRALGQASRHPHRIMPI